MHIYLDFDGVLHPDEVYVVRGKVVLKAEGSLFMWAPRLAEALTDRTDVCIVLSTSWVREVGFDAAKLALPSAIQEKVIGSTYHSKMCGDWYSKSRYQQIAGDRSRRGIDQRWLAIDDDVEGWPESARGNLIQTHPDRGLGDDAAFTRLINLLEKSS